MKKREYLILALIMLVSFTFICIRTIYTGRNVNKNGKAIIKVGAVYMTMNNPYFEVINKEIRAVIENQGDVLYTRDSNLDSDLQNRQIESLIDQGIDVLLVNAVDWKKVSEGLAKAKKAGIPVIAVDTEIYDDSLVDATIVSDNYNAGKICAQDLMKYRKKANILFLIQSDNKSSIDRISGFEETLKEKNWDYTVVDRIECQGQLEVAQPLVEEELKRTKNIDAVMALNDPSALGAMAALDAEGILSQVRVYGVDGAPEAKTMVKEGRMNMTVAQYPIEIGSKTTEIMYDLLEGKKTDKKTVIGVQKINLSNVDEFSLSGWQ